MTDNPRGADDLFSGPPARDYDISSERSALHNALNAAQSYTEDASKAEADDYILRLGRLMHAARVGWETANLRTCPFCFTGLPSVSVPGESDAIQDTKLFSAMGRDAYERYYGLGGR